MSEMDETTILAILTICIMLVSVGLSGCVEDNGERKIEYEYSVTVTTDNGSHGYLYLPFIMTPNYNETIFEKMKLDNPNLINGIVNTKYGNLLNVSFNSNLNLKFEGRIDDYIYLGMGIYDWNRTTKHEFIWLFVKINTSDILSINFIWRMSSSSTGDIWDFSGLISKNGWSKLEGEAKGWES